MQQYTIYIYHATAGHTGEVPHLDIKGCENLLPCQVSDRRVWTYGSVVIGMGLMKHSGKNLYKYHFVHRE